MVRSALKVFLLRRSNRTSSRATTQRAQEEPEIVDQTLHSNSIELGKSEKLTLCFVDCDENLRFSGAICDSSFTRRGDCPEIMSQFVEKNI